MGKKYNDFDIRMKSYEDKTKFMPQLPIIIRLDGRNFSKYTKGLDRPFDKRMSTVMIEVAKALVEETNAVISYTQSDEISLVLYTKSNKTQVYFNGKEQKIVSSLSALASVLFNKLANKYMPLHNHYHMPTFDCRAFTVPTLIEATNQILWRERDATKNSISMAAHDKFGHKKLMKKNSKEKKDMLMEAGVNWNNFPTFFKRGTFIQRKTVKAKLSRSDLDTLPTKHHAHLHPDKEIERIVIQEIDMPAFNKVSNRVEVIFEQAIPEQLC